MDKGLWFGWWSFVISCMFGDVFLAQVLVLIRLLLSCLSPFVLILTKPALCFELFVT